MNRALKILYNSYFTIIAAPIIAIVIGLLFDRPINIAFLIGFALGTIYVIFNFRFSYIDKICVENNILHIDCTNAFLQSRKFRFEMEEISNLKIFRKTWYNDFGRIEFNINDSHKRYNFFKTEEQMVLQQEMKES